MAKKTFKIGECCQGGILVVTTSDKAVNVKNLDWFSKNELQSKNFLTTDSNGSYDLRMFLNELTTSYHSDVVMKWVNTKVVFDPDFNFL